MSNKTVPVYFYYINLLEAKLKEGLLKSHPQEVVEFFEKALKELNSQDIGFRKEDYFGDKVAVWMDKVELKAEHDKNNSLEIANWSADIVMKSAKYDRVRQVIDTSTMVEDESKTKGRLDGEEEKTHFSIRYFHNRNMLLCIAESNYYGIKIGKFIRYFNEKLEQFRASQNLSYSYSLKEEPMPCNAFLEELRNMKSISLVTLRIPRSCIENQFMGYADRGDVQDTVDIVFRPDKKTKQERKYINKSTVKSYFDEMQNNEDIIRLTANGRNQSGTFTLDTEKMKKKQGIKVELMESTHEVKDDSFFEKAQELLERMKDDADYTSELSDNADTDS